MSVKRVLLSGRDPASVGHIMAIANDLRQSDLFACRIAASGVALDMLRRSGEDPIPFSGVREETGSGGDGGNDKLLDEARRLIQDVAPDAVIASLSTFGVGVDEALVAASDVPTYVMQDYWGDVNLGLGVAADLYFAMDEYAVALTRKRWGLESVAVGSPKHTLYGDVDIRSLRRAGRDALGIGEGDKAVAWFGQSSEIPGYRDVFLTVLSSLQRLSVRHKVILREHPKFACSDSKRMEDIRAFDLDVVDVTGREEAEQWLAAADLVLTPFSLCGLDHAFLSAYSEEPIGTTIYVVTNRPIQDVSRRLWGMDVPPLVHKGIGTVVFHGAELVDVIERGLGEESRLAYFNGSKGLIQEDPLPKIRACLLGYI